MKKTLLAFGLALLLAGILSPSCNYSAGLSKEETERYTLLGDSISNMAFAALSGKLQQAIADSGVLFAIPYCNLVAIPTMDSLSEAYGVEIRRTSLLIRNPANAANYIEEQILDDYKQAQKAGIALEPMAVPVSKHQALYARPIMTMPLCLQCHGHPGIDIQPEVAARIKKLYPGDKAIGYKAGDWRGIWSITFDRGDQ